LSIFIYVSIYDLLLTNTIVSGYWNPTLKILCANIAQLRLTRIEIDRPLKDLKYIEGVIFELIEQEIMLAVELHFAALYE